MRLETSKSEQEIFGELERLCASPGYIHVLAALSFRDNFVTFPGELTAEALAASYVEGRTVRTEFSTLMGLMLKSPIDFEKPPSAEIERLIEQSVEVLEELHAAFNMPMMASLRRGFEEAKAGVPLGKATPFLQGDVLREPIFYGGESAYDFQYRTFAVQRYAPDDDWLFANRGFRIDDAAKVARALNRLGNEQLSDVLDGLASIPPETWTLLPGFSHSAADIAAAAAVPIGIAEAVLAAFTAPEGPTNQGFKTIGDFNLANACPIIRAPNGDYVSLQGYGVVEALYDAPFYWMAADKAYRSTAFEHRGRFTEEFVADRLAAVFGEENVHRGVNVVRGRDRVSEIDILVLFANRAIVVQCKSKKLTLEARKGNDLQLQDDFKKAVQDANDQAHICALSLGDPAIRLVRGDGSEVLIPALKEIYPFCIVSDHYPALAAQVRQFLKFETDKRIMAPLVGDIFLIDVIAEMLASPLRFLSYVNRRVGYAGRISIVNELTILGYHLQNNLWLDEGMDLVTFMEDFTHPLDAAMMVRREGVPGPRTPEGILTRFEGTRLAKLLSNIENRAETGLVDLGFLLLSLNGDTLTDLEAGLAQLSAKTLADGMLHDFTLVFDDRESGLTLHCSRLPNGPAAEKLADHCRGRKYIQRADQWFGLSVRPEDGMPRSCIEVSFPWRRDPIMEIATSGVPRAGQKRRPASARTSPKVGRNEPCPCGSGLKFKKCCI